MTVVSEYLDKAYGTDQRIYNKFKILQYIEKKTQRVLKPKSRMNLGNLYAIYVLVEDYIKIGEKNYKKYNGATFSNLFSRQRELPFGSKLQNHALNSRCNEEFKKFFPKSELPIIRDLSTKRYWINVKLVKIENHDISSDIIDLIKKYISIISDDFSKTLSTIQTLDTKDKINDFFKDSISLDSDSRMFELASFVILKNYYLTQNIFIGTSKEQVKKQPLMLYKTGRTNANDGGIDYVMKPIGTFFQVTETLDFKKFFLDIEKINRYPITFVIKTADSKDVIMQKITTDAQKKYSSKTINQYIKSIEEIITISDLLSMLKSIDSNRLCLLLSDFKTHLQLEFNLR